MHPTPCPASVHPTPLLTACLQLSTFGVNYVGHPFNSSITENKGMYACLVYMFVFLGVITFDIVPGGRIMGGQGLTRI